MEDPNIVETFGTAIKTRNGKLAAKLFNVSHEPTLKYVQDAVVANTQKDISAFVPREWHEAVGLYFDSIQKMLSREYSEFMRCYEKFMTALNRVANSEDRWILPVLRQCSYSCYHMVTLCSSNDSEIKENYELASRCINGTLKICLNDRNSDDMSQSKKHGTFYFAGMLLRVYFRLKAYSLANGIVKAVQAASTVLPPLKSAPVSDKIVYHYYCGVLDFMAQKYTSAEQNLTSCLHMANSVSTKPKETILLYLIPTKLLVGSMMPSDELWQQFPRLSHVYRPIFRAIESGDVGLYQKLLEEKQLFLVTRHLYFAFNKLTQVCVLRLVVKTWKVLGRSNRLRISDLVIAFELRQYFGDLPLAEDDRLNAVELQVAQLISDGLTKGYISHSMRTIVLSNRNPFPTVVRPIEGR